MVIFYFLNMAKDSKKKDNKLKLPSDKKMDKKILKILNKNLVGGTAAEGLDGIVCNKFATSLKIVSYIKKLAHKK